MSAAFVALISRSLCFMVRTFAEQVGRVLPLILIYVEHINGFRGVWDVFEEAAQVRGVGVCLAIVVCVSTVVFACPRGQGGFP